MSRTALTVDGLHRRGRRTRPWVRGKAIECIVCLLWSTASASAGWAAESGTDNGFFSDAQAARGGALYDQYCTACHGARLEGNPGAPLVGATFLARWADGQHTLDDLFYVVRTLMPYNAPGTLTRQQNADVVAYILKVNGYPVGEDELPPNAAALKKMTLLPR